MCTICSAFRAPSLPCDYADLAGAPDVYEEADAAKDTSTAYTLSVGASFFGEIDDPGERDWVAITLEAGETYELDLYGDTSGAGSLADPIMAIYDSAGIYLAGNDDGGEGTEAHITFEASYSGTYYLMARAYSAGMGTYELSVEQVLPPDPEPPDPSLADLDTLAAYLTDGYWEDNGESRRAFDTAASNVITVDLGALTANGRQLARWAMEAWESVADIVFSEVSTGAMIEFDDNRSGAFASTRMSGGHITSASVNVDADWLQDYGSQFGGYAFQTYIHEIGHALGLGHQGFYDGGAVYGEDNLFINDSWQVSVMSYFSQRENTSEDATYASLVSAMGADILAIQELYGAAGAGSLTAGDTTYGSGHTLGDSWLGQFYSALNGTGYGETYDGSSVAQSIFDAGGYDTLNLSTDVWDQVIDLAPESFSDVVGATRSLFIARGTVIEAARAGSGDDTVLGNAAANALFGNDGNDTLEGKAGRDRLVGGAGEDTLRGGKGNDRLSGSGGADRLEGDAGADVLKGGGVRDRLFGGDGSDRLFGNAGKDRLEGGAGNDVLSGGRGNDVFIFDGGADVIRDFGKDRLRIDAHLMATGSGKEDALAVASVEGADTVFRFGGGNSLTLRDYIDLDALDGALLVI